ncbi:hypothetical protein NG99_04575 [Erwinia typographi]|uniref:Phage tail tape measure protein domain-containing protein n=1 Tax=Erwinia typographi TaxID=371042 RepID=A0A0A3ZBW2_9GAMM|nr:phage tail tape measure protein [Erwinia typographi]KGT95299.1 hypothetical protein NG99_04575 [Erwinia typographi]
MAGPFDTQIGIGVKDNATAGITRIRNEVQRMQEARERLGVRSENTIRRAIQQTEASLNRLARSGTISAAELSRAQEKAATKIIHLQKEMAEAEVRSFTSRNAAREAYTALGIRSEHSVQREIQRTEAAYNRLERSGVLSASELQRAQEKTISTVARLRRELGQADREQRTFGQNIRRSMSVIGGVGGAIAGVGLALHKPITDAASYDHTLRETANFAYNSGGIKEREAGMKRMDSSIRDAVGATGASADEAFSALRTMWRSGVMQGDSPYKYLSNVLRNAVATGADAESVANTQASTVNFGLGEKDSQAGLSVLTTMAQHGSIDVPKLAHEMPRGLESGKSAGFYGPRGFSQLAAFFEASAIGAKNPEDAATNANDFLAELTSKNLANNAGGIQLNGKKLDLRGMMRYDLAHGKTALDTVTGVISKMDKADPDYRHLTKQLSSASTDEQRAKLRAQLDQIHGQHISQLFPNQQARNAYLNFDRNRDFYNQLVGEGVSQFSLPEGERSADVDFQLIQRGPQWKTDRATHLTQVTGNEATSGAAGLWGDFMNHIADLEQKFPALGEAVSGVTTAFKAITGGTIGGTVGGAIGGMTIFKKLRNMLTGNSAAVAEGAEGAEAAGATSGGVLGSIGRWLTGGARAVGGAVINGGKSAVTDGIVEGGLLSNPLALTIAGLVYPSDTVSGSSESAELARLKNQNYGKNSRQTSSEALSYLQNWKGNQAPAGGQPVVRLPAQQVPVVNVSVTLNDRDIAAAVHVLMDQNARRHGA